MNGYIPTIGIECHVQLKTKTKLFAAISNDARGAAPNTLVSHICFGMPGALPVLNEAAIHLAIKAALALQTTPQLFSSFDRKHYFYPDLPKGYQISQFNHPIISGGKVDIETEEGKKSIGITRAHLEEDAGKSTHPAGKNYSLVDLNRAGTPLLEIVSEPVIRSSSEAKAYARELYLLMRYADVSDADMYHGNMRFDVNVSVSKDPDSFGIRTETKNLNSFRSVERAIEYEIKRQIDVLESGKQVVQETRGWDEAKQKTVVQRTKEEAHDYRYFPDPDIPPVLLNLANIKETESAMPVMPGVIRERLKSLKIDNSAVETIIDEMAAAKLIMECFKDGIDDNHVRRIALWLAGDIQGYVSNNENIQWSDLVLQKDPLMNLSKLVEESQVSSTGAKVVLLELVTNGGEPREIAEKKDVLQVSDSTELEAIVDKIISENPQAAEDVRNGEMKAAGFLVGQVMKASRGKANPKLVQELIRKKLGT